jgi:hypothetical protein
MTEEESYELISVDLTDPWFGAQVGKGLLRTHGTKQCSGPLGENGRPICCIHNQSKHHMVSWPQNWRSDKNMMERLCSHGIGHPDPDDLKVRTTNWAGIHGCDGCCAQPTDAVPASRTSPCPNDTNGDGDCGQRLCPHCGGGPPWTTSKE